MTGYTVHTGSSVKFSSSWDRIFQSAGKKAAVAASSTTKAAKPAKKAVAAKADTAAAPKKVAKSAKAKAPTKGVKKGK